MGKFVIRLQRILRDPRRQSQPFAAVAGREEKASAGAYLVAAIAINLHPRPKSNGRDGLSGHAN